MVESLRAAALLLTLSVVFSECRTQSDRPQRRSGPIRSVPVAADIKRDTNFDCPEEFGYYPHPTDCTQYYVCVFGGALLESCTGGLMYSHELQTCDWPRNVGCDAIGDVGDEIERVVEKKPLPTPPPRRFSAAAPPPPPRAQPQPNPVITSRGQPKIYREEYEKQQQLYAEVDDLPPVEEIETDRQQRVYRGQPSTIGQVQRDRDGYAQVSSSGRTLNSNIIPASIQQSNVKIGSFSFGTQVDERRPTATQVAQAYSADNLTDSHHDRQSDIDENIIDGSSKERLSILVRRKRNTEEATNLDKTKETTTTVKQKETNETNGTDNISNRNDRELEDYNDGADMEFIEDEDENSNDEFERGKRQIRHGRHYYKNNYKTPGKNWGNSKPINQVDVPQFNFHQPTNNQQSLKFQPYNNLNQNYFFDGTRKPSYEEALYSTANPFIAYQTEGNPQKPFKASLPDPSNQKQAYNPINAATQIITKSPPISSLPNNDNPFASLSGGFFNNLPHHTNNQNQNQYISAFASNSRPNNQNSFIDSSLGSTSIVTGTSVLSQSPRPQNKYKANHELVNSNPSHHNHKEQNTNHNQKPVQRPTSHKDYDDRDDGSNEENNSSEESSENDGADSFKHDFPEPPYEFTHPSNKFADIKNPFADPNFDFDEFISKLSGDNFKTVTVSSTTKYHKNSALKNHNLQAEPEESTPSSHKQEFRTSTLNYHGMSTPRPFSVPTGESIVWQDQSAYIQSTTKQPLKFEQIIQRPLQQSQDSYRQHQQQQQTIRNEHVYNRPQGNIGSLQQEGVRPKLKPPNFIDDRQLPINYNFHHALQSTVRPHFANSQFKGEHENKQQYFSVTQKPYVVVSGTGSPIIFSTPKQQYLITGKPYLVSSVKPQNNFIAFKHSTAKPLTTLANEQLSALQNFWNNPSQRPEVNIRPTRPTKVSDIPKLENLFSKPTSQSRIPEVTQNLFKQYFTSKQPLSSTTAKPSTRKPIPKPSPEMPDYYYDDDEQYYYEPPVKSQYMPSSEVRPQRPPMAQNYQEYEDSESYEDESPETNTQKPQQPRRPANYNTYKTDSATKNPNDVSIVTKVPYKEVTKNHFKENYMSIMMNSVTPTPTVLIRPEVMSYEIHHSNHRNRTFHIKKPSESGPHTVKPPKYLNQTTLRPYTVRHRLAKPTTVQSQPTPQPTQEPKPTRGRTRHPNIVTQMRVTTPRDNHNQESRYTKTKHDDRTNSLEPTESITPTPYSASPRPKMLYNGSQNYQPDQYDPFYAVYDEDSELYKDNDYVQQYNLASIRPAVQQTYRGTPPPPRRPVETFTARPVSADDYDEALIQGQIVQNNQNQYQQGIRHSTRGEGNELGFDLPSSGRTTQYEATSISTTPSTTSSTSTTTTTTQRPTTVARITEAMTPSLRSSTNEKPVSTSPSLINKATPSSVPLTTPPIVNFSSLAKPFEKTENLHRLRDTSTPRLPTLRQPSNKNVDSVEVNDNRDNKKVVSLTTGFSIRRNKNNTNNPYTLTVITRPFEEYGKGRDDKNKNQFDKEKSSHRYYYDNDSTEKYFQDRNRDTIFENTSIRRSSQELISEEEPILVKPSAKLRVIEPRHKTSTVPTTTATKYFLKTVIKRPVPFSSNNENYETSTENIIDTEALIEKALRNTRFNNHPNNEKTPNWDLYDQSEESVKVPAVSSHESLSNLRVKFNSQEDYVIDTTTSSSTTQYTTVKPREGANYGNVDRSQGTTTKPSYYAYHLLDDGHDQTTEVFSAKAKSILKAFISNFVTTPKPKVVPIHIISTTARTTTEPEEVVNIGFKKTYNKYFDEKPYRSNFPRLQIITEPTFNEYVHPSANLPKQTVSEFKVDVASTTTSTPSTTSPTMLESTTNTQFRSIPSREMHDSRFSAFVTSESPDNQNSRKFSKFVTEEAKDVNNYKDSISDNKEDNELTKLTNYSTEDVTKTERDRLQNKFTSTTTSTIKSTSTYKPIEPTTPTKSLSFPTRASRVNPAIKLAAANPGGGRRSYQSPTKCSDNGLQENPKCNEIKYQRPSPTRGRGSAHYSTLSGSEPQPPQQTSNRGTPPTRSRPTLKPSTAIVSKSTEFIDIYAYPPRRPSAVYPQPTPDKTAAKCRKDVCLLPDCSCGGKDIPGELPVESIPQIVLLTFDDSVNDLNKVLYQDLFDKGRVNPNGCPISATFYVSHEWTDYSQVQNLYAAGHEMASHTISHSFGEQFSQKKWNREVAGQREILAAYGGVKLEDVRGMRAPFLSVGGNKMFKMLYDSNFTYDSSMPVYENRPPSWPYTLDYKLFHDCMIPPCPTKSYPGVWEVPMVMWQDLNGGRCSMGDACANPSNAEGVYKMLLKNFDRHYTTNRAPFGLFYHAAWFTQPHHKEGFIMFLDFINGMNDVWIVTNWQALQWVRDPTPINRLNNFQPFQCDYPDRPKKCNNPKVCNLWHKSGVRYMRTCQPCPEIFPWTGKTGIRSSRIDNDIEE